MSNSIEDERKKLVTWLDKIHQEVTHAIFDQHIFWEVQTIIRSNPELQNKSNHFYSWMASNYAASAALAIRRQNDKGGDVVSLKRFLEALQRKPGIINREYHVSLYKSLADNAGWPVDQAEAYGNSIYSQHVGKNLSQLNADSIKRELEELALAADNVHHYVDRTIAHSDKRPPALPLPKYSDLDDCLKLIEKLVIRYALLLQGQGSEALLSNVTYDWKEIFRFAWITPTQSSPAAST